MDTEHKLKHLAIIMDGNRRWAKEQGLPTFAGHKAGADTFETIVRAIRERNIPYCTFYALSTENLKNRTKRELNNLYSLLNQVPKRLNELLENNIRLNIIGNLEELPAKTRGLLLGAVEKTKHHTAMVLTLAVNYGGRDEIVRAVKKLMKDGGRVTEEKLQNYLDTADLPNVDLLIRTGGEQRLSNYLPWQTVYAELYFSPVKWPAFTEKDLQKAFDWFQTQKRNGGK